MFTTEIQLHALYCIACIFPLNYRATECRKIKTKMITQSITTDANNTMNPLVKQIHVLNDTEHGKKHMHQNTIGFGFASDSLTKSCTCFEPVTEGRNAKHSK